MTELNVKIKLLRDVQPPTYAREGDSGMDCFLPLEHTAMLFEQSTIVIPLGFALEIPPGYEGQVRPKSGLSKRGLDVALGTIDSGYRGEVCATVTAFRQTQIKPGEKVCQIVFAPVARARLEVTSELGESERGTGGYGSTGR